MTGASLIEAITDLDVPPCGYTHADHLNTWKSWKDDCDVCGFGIMDVDQCWRGHPDDGVTACGGCGHGEISGEGTLSRAELAARWRQHRAEWLREAIEDLASMYGESKWVVAAIPADQHERRERHERVSARQRAALEWLTRALAAMAINPDNYPPRPAGSSQ